LGQVVSQNELFLRRSPWKGGGHVVVCVHGSFDLLHPGHIRLLEQARSLGHILVLAVRSDASVRASHESGKFAASGSIARPITPIAERMEILAALAAVDYVVEIDDQSWPDFCARLSPDVVVRGADGEAPSSAPKIHGARDPAAPRIETIPLEPGYSTAQLIERIKQPRRPAP
jgi:rfaE bifunctional protein nucleotidyltransferase chain/domain